MTSLLTTMRSPSAAERKRGAEVVFERRDERGRKHTILACECYESWEQWGAETEILCDNCDDVEAWRQRSREERRAIERGAD